jgi:hypothetical protein
MKFRKILLLLFVALFAGSAAGQAHYPKTPREFFTLLSQKHFYLETIENITDDNYTREQLRRAQKRYLESFLEIEDTRNGFMQGGGDGSQERFKLALFKRPNGTFVAGLGVWGEWGEKYEFLEYKNGKLNEVSTAVIPGYERSHIYEMPRYGTTIRVFERKNFNAEFSVGEKGRKLYDLVWKNGKFRIRK